jgi:hypothetical protein
MQSFRLARPRQRAPPPAAFAPPAWTEEEDAAPDTLQVAAAAAAAAPESDADVAASRALQDAGNALAETGQFPGALREWGRALKLTPRRAELHESMVARITALPASPAQAR